MSKDIDQITEKIIGAAIVVHKELGPGLLESAYETCLVYELSQLGLGVERQKSLPVSYRSVKIDCGYRIDLLVEDKVVVELKAVERLGKIYEAQLLSYLKLSGYSVGMLINFNEETLTKGLKRLVYKLSYWFSQRALCPLR